MVDEGLFDGLTRDGIPITKTFGGDEASDAGGSKGTPLRPGTWV